MWWLIVLEEASIRTRKVVGVLSKKLADYVATAFRKQRVLTGSGVKF